MGHLVYCEPGGKQSVRARGSALMPDALLCQINTLVNNESGWYQGIFLHSRRMCRYS